jgi:hypothetical protein
MTSSTSNSKSPPRTVIAGVVLFGVCLAASGLILKAVFFKPNFQSMAVDALGPSTQVLVIGSSRVLFGVDPRRYEPGLVNLAADYLDFATAEELWQLHQAKVSALKGLVLEFGLATLRYDTRELEPFACYHLGLSGLSPLRMFGESFDAAVHRSLSVFLKWRLTPLFWQFERDMMNSPLEPMAAVPGFVPTMVEYPENPTLASHRQERTIRQLASQDPRVYRRNIQAAARLIAEANARGVKVTLLRFPKSPDARPLYLPEWDQIIADATAELRTDPRGLRFELVDLNRDARFVQEDFRDPDHLNRRGAEHLAEVLGPRFGL